MTDQNLPQVGGGGFENLKKVNDYGAEYWSARDLQPLLGYSQWRRFENAIKKAITSCEQSGNEPSHHFAGAGKPIPGGKGAVQVVPDFQLSRFACYLIAQNGDPRKPQIEPRLRLELGDCADHKFIKQRHRERNIAVRRAVNHPLLDQPGTLSNTVLPTPRSPVSSMLFSARFCLIRPRRMRACSRDGSLPTNSGGGEPAPGENGFLIGSMLTSGPSIESRTGFQPVETG
ncbi:MAG: BRO family protein [Thermoguttaceae bacterium]